MCEPRVFCPAPIPTYRNEISRKRPRDTASKSVLLIDSDDDSIDMRFYDRFGGRVRAGPHMDEASSVDSFFNQSSDDDNFPLPGNGAKYNAKRARKNIIVDEGYSSECEDCSDPEESVDRDDQQVSQSSTKDQLMDEASSTERDNQQVSQSSTKDQLMDEASSTERDNQQVSQSSTKDQLMDEVSSVDRDDQQVPQSSTKDQLKNHEFTCQFCKKEYSNKSNMCRHMKICKLNDNREKNVSAESWWIEKSPFKTPTSSLDDKCRSEHGKKTTVKNATPLHSNYPSSHEYDSQAYKTPTAVKVPTNINAPTAPESKRPKRQLQQVKRFVPPSGPTSEEISLAHLVSPVAGSEEESEINEKTIFYRNCPGATLCIGRVVARLPGGNCTVQCDKHPEETIAEQEVIDSITEHFMERYFCKNEDGEIGAGRVIGYDAPNFVVRYFGEENRGFREELSAHQLELYTEQTYVGKKVYKCINGIMQEGIATKYTAPYFTVKYDTVEEIMTAKELFGLIEKSFVNQKFEKDFGPGIGMGVWKGVVHSFNSLFYRLYYPSAPKNDCYEDVLDEEVYQLVPLSKLSKSKTAKAPRERKVSKETTVPPAWQVPPTGNENHLFCGMRPLVVELSSFHKSNFEAGRTFFSELFPFDRILILKQKITGRISGQRPSATFEQFGNVYSLVGVKDKEEGRSFGGLVMKSLEYMYVSLTSPSGGPPISLSRELSRIADFAALKSTRKVAARLELLHSCSIFGCTPRRMVTSDFDRIKEPQSENGDYMGDGCGFIGIEMLRELLGGTLDKQLAIQVRVFGPQLGVYKGMLCVKEGIKKIQLTPSMKKVGPSIISEDEDFVSLVVIRANPSAYNGQLIRQFRGEKAAPSFERKFLSKMVRRLMHANGCPLKIIREHVVKQHPEHAWVVGLADPTKKIPSGHIFVTGFKEVRSWRGCKQVFITRSPCVKKEDGRLLPVITEKPSKMDESTWNWLLDLPFGGVIFSTRGSKNKRPPLASTVASGDLDGDLYLVCWDNQILCRLEDNKPPPIKVKVDAPSTGYRNENWLEDAQNFLLDSQRLKEHALVGKLYREMEKIQANSPLGMTDPDAVAYAEAYIAAIDNSKHDIGVNLPPHLRKSIGLLNK